MSFPHPRPAAPADGDSRPTPNPSRPVARWAASPWVRLPVFFVTLLAVNAIAAGINHAADATAWTALIAGVATGVAALAVYAGLVRRLEGRRPQELTLAKARPELCRGALLGLGLFAVTIAAVALSGGYHVRGWGSIGGSLTTLGLMSCVAVTEELAFRGALFRILEEKAGTYGAVIVSGLAFGTLHLVNENATLWGALAIAVEAGLMFGALYAATRSLWPVIGVHLGWNMAEQGIFGTAVSGSGSGTGGLLDASTSGPHLLSGGSFGPEAGIFAILVCSVATVVFLRAAERRGRIHGRGELARARRG
ncbi:CPBP family intramembrane metalloprotease [Streptomyces sp. NBC_01218]|uniref:CPBP family intramembrane glutamic endopeptidase n=1 Tax=unclassified Streptomyces TaxID=2593676 RepID=UPI0023B9864B|nr:MULTISPECIES: type II CAAX endopeptidase family protein [unclassified Streptomyces]WEH40238.1 type II CAAX endopeptidase family protein [Streptomyces sp. AM 2-1-1]WSQ51936.1 CPBP family intramembrane metalloprotease [Streptomyces sp. NBC_01218]